MIGSFILALTVAINVTGKCDYKEWVKTTGAIDIFLGRSAKPLEVAAAKATGAKVWTFLYGCNAEMWNKRAYDEWIAEHPSAKGESKPNTWEKGVMCPSDKYTWMFFAQAIKAKAIDEAEGVVVCFWDDYGLNCHCKRCRKNGFAGNFSKQLTAAVKCYEEALEPLGKKLLVRTWSSGAAHWLRDEWVTAPGNGGWSGSGEELWGPVIRLSSPKTIFQTKVYNADCQPNPPLNPILGLAKKLGRQEYAEWQITGQTVGHHVLPASVIKYTEKTMRAAKLAKVDGYMCYFGCYRNGSADLLKDDLNVHNVHAWSAFVHDRPYSAPPAFLATERAAAVAFAPLGLGASTESKFANTIERREDLLRYTNRQLTDEGKVALKPTKENIARVIAEKDQALEELTPYLSSLPAAQRERYDQLIAQLKVAKALDGALWRYRYLRYLMDMGDTDLEVYAAIQQDFNYIKAHAKELPEVVGSPINLIREIFEKSTYCKERIVGR